MTVIMIAKLTEVDNGLKEVSTSKFAPFSLNMGIVTTVTEYRYVQIISEIDGVSK